MKKNLIAIVLTCVMVMGSITLTPVRAAEMTDQEAVTVEKDSAVEPEVTTETMQEATEVADEEAFGSNTEAVSDETTQEEEEIAEQEAAIEEGADEPTDTTADAEELADTTAGAEVTADVEEDAADNSNEAEAAGTEAASGPASEPDIADAAEAAEPAADTAAPAVIEEAAETAIAKEPAAAASHNIDVEYKNAETINAGDSKYIISGVPARYFKFVAKEDGYYRISPGSTDYIIPYAILYNSKREKVDEENGYYWDLCYYRLEFYSKKGQTWYIEVNGSMDEEDPESYYVYLKRFAPGKTTRGDMYNQADDVKVTWKEVPGARYYKVYREGVTTPKETRSEPVIVTTRTYGWDQKPGLTDGHAYRYRIVASLTGKNDSDGDSPASYAKVMYRLKNVAIKSVQNTAPGKVTVKYDKTNSGDSYVIQYSDRKDMAGAITLVVKGADNTTKVLGGLKKGKTYYIQIRVRKNVKGVNYYTTFGRQQQIKIER